MPKVYIDPDHQEPRDIENALRKLKKVVEKCGVLKKLYEKEGYERPGLFRNRKKAASIRRHKREQEKNKIPPKLY